MNRSSSINIRCCITKGSRRELFRLLQSNWHAHWRVVANLFDCKCERRKNRTYALIYSLSQTQRHKDRQREKIINIWGETKKIRYLHQQMLQHIAARHSSQYSLPDPSPKTLKIHPNLLFALLRLFLLIPSTTATDMISSLRVRRSKIQMIHSINHNPQ